MASAPQQLKNYFGLALQRHRPERQLLLALALSAFALWAFIEIAEEMLEGDSLKFDQRILMALRSATDPSLPLGPTWLREVMRDITALGSTVVLVLVTLVSIGFFALIKNWRGAPGAGCRAGRNAAQLLAESRL